LALRDLLRGILNSRIDNPESALAAAIGGGFTFGSWTPVLGGQNSSGVGTYTMQFGQYARAGRIVIAQFRVIGTAHTGSGQAWVSMPFGVAPTVPTTGGYFTGALYTTSTAAFTSATPNTSRAHMYSANPGGVSNIGAGAFDYNASLTYFTDDP
jgi:hypothetical protein